MSDEDVAVDQDNTAAEPEEELSEDEQAMAKLKEAISVEREEIGSLRLKMTVTIPQDALDERRGEQFLELKRDAMIPGFRKGHAPMRLVEKRFASDVGEQLKSQLVGSGYLAAVEKEDLKPLGDPMFKVTVEEERVDDDGRPHKVRTEKLLPIDDALDHIDMPNDGPLTFSCELELKPEFELPELEKIPVEQPALTICDDDVEEEVKRMLMMRGSFEPVEKGGVHLDDMLYADMKMSVEGQAVASEDNFDLAARDLRIKGVPLKGFGAAVKGKKIGELVTFQAPVPDDHENIDIRGKTAEFEFTIREIKRLKLPPLDKEFLSTVGFESKKELQDTIRSTLESQLDAAVKGAMREQVGQYLIDKTKLEIPEGLSQRQTDRSIARRMVEMYQAGVPQAQIEKTMDELRAKAHDQSVRDLKLFFILEKIADEREITIGEEEFNGAIAQIAQRSNKRFDRVRDELSKGEGLTVLYHQLRDQRVLASLLEDAEITEGKAPKESALKKPTAKAPAPRKPAAKAPDAEKVKKKASPNKKAAKKKTGKSTA